MKCIFVGYPSDYKGWVFWHPESRRLIISDTAVFDERAPEDSGPRPIAPPHLSPSFIKFFLPGGQDTPDQGGVLDDHLVHLPNVPNTSDTRPAARNIPPPVPVAPIPIPAPAARPAVPPAVAAPIPPPAAVPPPIPPLGYLPPADVAVPEAPPVPPPAQPIRRSTRDRQPPKEYWKVTPEPAEQHPASPVVKQADEDEQGDEQDEQDEDDEEEDDEEDGEEDEDGEEEEEDEEEEEAEEEDGEGEEGEDEEVGDEEAGDEQRGEEKEVEEEKNEEEEEEEEGSEDELLLKGGANFASFDGDLTPEAAFDLVFRELLPHSALAAKSSPHGEPRSFAEAMASPDKEKWYEAAAAQIRALIENGTWELVKLPAGKKAIGSRWVFRIKRNADGSIERYKGRLVAQGFSQRPGIDYEETFAPTPRWNAIRAILALAALEDLELVSVDISNAFLNGTIEEEVYMRQPEGFQSGTPDHVCRLIKSLYGLKQAPRAWHHRLNTVLTKDMGFQRVLSDHSIWVWTKGDVRIIVPVFVDDMTLACKDKGAIERVISDLEKHFKLRRLGNTSLLLGVHIIRDRSKRCLQLSQRQYILDILNRHGFEESRMVKTPMDPGLRLSSKDAENITKDQQHELDGFDYRACVGELLYVAVCTRPDIARTVALLGRYNSCPGYRHMQGVKHLWRYLRATIDYKLTYQPDPAHPELFHSYCDADHGGCLDTGRSTSGYVVKMGTGAISWMSKLQTIVTLSTTEAEFVSACSAAQEIIWLRALFKELGYDVGAPSTLSIDNRSALSVAKNPQHHGRMKHLHLRFFWLREVVNDGKVKIGYISTNVMPADILTKSLAQFKVVASRKMLGVM